MEPPFLSLKSEFSEANLGDARRAERLQQIAELAMVNLALHKRAAPRPLPQHDARGGINNPSLTRGGPLP